MRMIVRIVFSDDPNCYCYFVYSFHGNNAQCVPCLHCAQKSISTSTMHYFVIGLKKNSRFNVSRICEKNTIKNCSLVTTSKCFLCRAWQGVVAATIFQTTKEFAFFVVADWLLPTKVKNKKTSPGWRWQRAHCSSSRGLMSQSKKPAASFPRALRAGGR